MLGLLVLLGTLQFPRCRAAVMLEQPLAVLGRAGGSVTLPCVVRTQVSYIHWYRHQEGTAPERLLRLAMFKSDVQWDSVLKADKVTAMEASDGSSCTLSVLRLQKGDEGTYYCAAWDPTAGHPGLAAAQKAPGFLNRSRSGKFHPCGAFRVPWCPPAPSRTLQLNHWLISEIPCGD